MIQLTQKTVPEISLGIAERISRIRKRRRISQNDLARKADVSFGSIKRFERTGEISLKSLTKIAIALEIEDELDSLFSEVEYRSMDEVLNG